MTAEQRWRTAAHEAGHALMALRFGHEVAVVRCTPSPGALGSCIHKAPPIEYPEGDTLIGGVLDISLTWRRELEQDVCILLAGRAAELHCSPPESGYIADDDEDEAARLVAARLRLSPAARRMADDQDADHAPNPTDETKVYELARAIAGQRLVHAYLSWLRLETEHIVGSFEFRRQLALLVPALVIARELDEPALRHILAADTDGAADAACAA